MSEQYTYAVARIRALEVSLFSDSTIDQLIACQSYDQALQFLEEKGGGDTESIGRVWLGKLWKSQAGAIPKAAGMRKRS